jgi:Na+-translocating ferredoxin:NAD+ oxidoreductase subunit B
MEKTDNVYTELQKHLDKQAVGFPATKSGVEIRVLKHFFNPEQASLALHINYQPQSTLDIFNHVKGSGVPLEKVKSMLGEMVNNGAIGIMERKGIEYYFTMPLLVGMLEWHGHKATPQFAKDFGEYVNGEFGRAYASTKISQMRTIPVEKSIKVEHHITTYDNIRDIINSTDGPIAVSRCMCRESAGRRSQPCHATSRSETCMSFGDWARHFIKAGLSRQVTREEALEITRQNEADGLVLQPTNYQNIDFVCACCGCCCGILRVQKMMPRPAETWAHNFFAAVETEKCTACGTCVEKCQVNAAKIDDQNGYSTINLGRCIGCGNCVATCPSEALRLVKKEKETVPPEDCTSLYKILAERRA